MSKDENRRVIIVSMPGAMQESLRATLEAMPRLEVVGLAGGGLSAKMLVEEKVPDVVVIDSNLPEDEVLALLREMKCAFAQIRVIVLTSTMRRHQRVLDSGADALLARWSSAKAFADAVDGSDQ